jgi:DNA repair protein RAD50
LHNELEKLRDEQRYMENDLSNIQIRWHTLREEKVKAANTLRDVKKAEEELERLTEEKSQVDLDEKVVCPSKIFIGIAYIICQ